MFFLVARKGLQRYKKFLDYAKPFCKKIYFVKSEFTTQNYVLDYQQKTHRRNDALFVLNTCISLDYCIIPTRYLLGRRVVSFRVPDDALHTHSNVRDEDILSGKDILYY